MFGSYEAVVETNDSTYRAAFIAPGVVGIYEDGQSGLQDRIRLDDSRSDPSEQLTHTLVIWIYEMRRGLEITKVTARYLPIKLD